MKLHRAAYGHGIAIRLSGEALALLGIAALGIFTQALSITAHGASQGDWGPTSTASANITLRILPRDKIAAAARHEPRAALQAYCGQDRTFGQSIPLFTASWAHSGESELDPALRSTCSGQPGAALESSATGSAGPLTVLIAPI